jgi:WD40 repeat protein
MIGSSKARVLRLIRETLGLSAHILLRDPYQLASQLTGRLLDVNSEPVQRILSGTLNKTDVWLRPLTASLEKVGDARRMTLIGHRGGVNAVAITPDSTRAISGGSDGTIRVWDIDVGREILVLQNPGGELESLVMTPDGSWVLTGSIDGAVRIWNWRTGALVGVMKGHDKAVSALCCSCDGRLAISASDDRTVRVWDLEHQTQIHVLRGHIEPVRDVVITPDGIQAVSASSDKTIRVWDLDAGVELTRLNSSWGQFSLDITPDGTMLVSGSEMVPLVWDLSSMVMTKILTSYHDGPLDDTNVIVTTISTNGTKLISAAISRVMRVWDLNRDYPLTGNPDSTIATWTGHQASVTDLAVSPDGRRAVSASLDATLIVWNQVDLQDKSEKVKSTAVGFPVKWIGFGPKQEIIVLEVGYRRGRTEFGEDSEWEGALRVGPKRFRLDRWDNPVKDIAQTVDRGTLLLAVGNGIEAIDISEMDSRDEGKFGIWRKIAVSQDGGLAAGHNWTKKTLMAWDRRGGYTWVLDSDVKEIEAIAFASEGSRVVVGMSNGLLRVWDTAGHQGSHMVKGHRGRVGVLIADRSGRIISCGDDGWIKVWDRELTKADLSLRTPWTKTHNLVIANDGSRLAAVSNHGAVVVWNLTNGQSLFELPEGSVKTSGEWNTDLSGKPLANLHLLSRFEWVIACNGTNLTIWDVSTGTQVASFTGDGAFESCSVSPDDSVVAVGTVLSKIHMLAIEAPNMNIMHGKFGVLPDTDCFKQEIKRQINTTKNPNSITCKCGHKNPAGERWCKNCGREL